MIPGLHQTAVLIGCRSIMEYDFGILYNNGNYCVVHVLSDMTDHLTQCHTHLIHGQLYSDSGVPPNAFLGELFEEIEMKTISYTAIFILKVLINIGHVCQQ